VPSYEPLSEFNNNSDIDPLWLISERVATLFPPELARRNYRACRDRLALPVTTETIPELQALQIQASESILERAWEIYRYLSRERFYRTIFQVIYPEQTLPGSTRNDRIFY